MMKKALLLFITFFSIRTGDAQLADSLKSHLDSAINILQKHALYAGRVNWVEARSQAYRDAADAKNKQQFSPWSVFSPHQPRLMYCIEYFNTTVTALHNNNSY